MHLVVLTLVKYINKITVKSALDFIHFFFYVFVYSADMAFQVYHGKVVLKRQHMCVPMLIVAQVENFLLT